MSKTFSASELAAELNVTDKEIRKEIRAIMRGNGAGDALPGKGKRYALDAKTYGALKRECEKRFAAKANRAQKLADAVALLPE